MTYKINAEYASYQDLVNARAEEIRTRESIISYPYFYSNYVPNEANSIVVGQTPTILSRLGFADTMIYDREHFEEHLLPSKDEVGGAPHGHNGAVGEMLMLPDLARSPLAVVSMDAVEPNSTKRRNYKPVGVLFSCVENGKQEFKLAVVQPQDIYNGVVRGFCDGEKCMEPDSVYAARIMSYHSIPEAKFARIMGEAVREPNKNLIYFNKNQYEHIVFSDSRNDRCRDLNFVNNKTVNSYSHSAPELKTRAKRHMNKVQTAIENAFMSYTNKTYFPSVPTSYPYVDEMLDICKNREKYGISVLADAYKQLVSIAQKYAPNPSETIHKLSVDFANNYCQILGEKRPEIFLSPYLKEAIDCPVNTDEEYDEFYDQIDFIEETVPTLDNLGIELQGNDESIKAAINTSYNLKVMTRGALGEIIELKESGQGGNGWIEEDREWG